MRNKMNSKKNKADRGSIESDSATTVKQQLRRDILRIIAATVLVLASITAGAVLFVSMNTYRSTSKQTDDYFIRAADIENGIKTNLKALNDKFALGRLDSFFSKDDVHSYAYNLWKYELLVNGKPIASTNTLTIAPGDEIIIKESLEETMLPPEFLAYGNLTRGDVNDSLKNHFSLKGKTYILNEKKEKLTTIYKVEELSIKTGEEFFMFLSVQLQERLDFESDIITVTVK